MSNRIGYSPESQPMATLDSSYTPAQVAAQRNFVICCKFEITGVVTVFIFLYKLRGNVPICAIVCNDCPISIRSMENKIISIYFEKILHGFKAVFLLLFESTFRAALQISCEDVANEDNCPNFKQC